MSRSADALDWIKIISALTDAALHIGQALVGAAKKNRVAVRRCTRAAMQRCSDAEHECNRVP